MIHTGIHTGLRATPFWIPTGIHCCAELLMIKHKLVLSCLLHILYAYELQHTWQWSQNTPFFSTPLLRHMLVMGIPPPPNKTKQKNPIGNQVEYTEVKRKTLWHAPQTHTHIAVA